MRALGSESFGDLNYKYLIGTPVGQSPFSTMAPTLSSSY